MNTKRENPSISNLKVSDNAAADGEYFQDLQIVYAYTDILLKLKQIKK